MIRDAATSETLRERSDEGGGARLAPLKPHLFVVFEADRPIVGGARYALEGVDEVVIGRGKERTAVREALGARHRLVVRFPCGWMSSIHARLVRERDGWFVEDAASKNGTFIGGEKVSSRTQLGEGDLLRAGHVLFVLRLALPTPRSASLDADTEALDDVPAGIRTLYPHTAESLAAVARVAKSDVPILLFGESGTGKEVLSRALYAGSGRRGPFVAVNCGALPSALVESLLFGHVRGAFSSAVRDEPGLVRSADTGTLFLDEVGELSLPAQTSLLRVLQEREVLPVGGTRPTSVDLRVICATHRPLDTLVARGAFRGDLLARLDGFRHTIPPLRERQGDLGLILAALLAKLGVGRERPVSFAVDAALRIGSYEWPGNVRELEQALGRGLALSADGQIDETMLSLGAHAAPHQSPRGVGDPAADARIHERLIAELSRNRGNVSEVARSMGKARMQVQRWMRRFGLDAAAYRTPR